MLEASAENGLAYIPSEEVVKYIASDILTQYLQSIMQQLQQLEATNNEKSADVSGQLTKLYSKAEDNINNLSGYFKWSADALAQMLKTINYYQQNVASNLLTTYQANYNFVKNDSRGGQS